MFTIFDNIIGRSGIFFRGICPLWVICDRGLSQSVYMDVASSSLSGTKATTFEELIETIFSRFDQFFNNNNNTANGAANFDYTMDFN